jgi:hypothetical protein
MMSVNMSVPARVVKGVATALIAGSRTPGFKDALAVCFWFTQDAVRLPCSPQPAPSPLTCRRLTESSWGLGTHSWG